MNCAYSNNKMHVLTRGSPRARHRTRRSQNVPAGGPQTLTQSDYLWRGKNNQTWKSVFCSKLKCTNMKMVASTVKVSAGHAMHRFGRWKAVRQIMTNLDEILFSGHPGPRKAAVRGPPNNPHLLEAFDLPSERMAKTWRPQIITTEQQAEMLKKRSNTDINSRKGREIGLELWLPASLQYDKH